MFAKIMSLRSRHVGERLIIAAARHIAGRPPEVAEGRAMLARTGVSDGGTSSLTAAITLLPAAVPGLRLHEISSPFVSEGEVILLGELARRQRVNPQPFRAGVLWPLSVEPALDRLLGDAAKALGDAGLLIYHRTISSAGDLARELPPVQGSFGW
ncbi:hypothetical protein [Sphingomonas gei]|uniref:hypothetical protein n=1 Tax=Sphingomonas gei TaxID=1395960 RepID=UPI00144228B8|nr:hypothetical protein [Sphingomonas gei]